MTMTVKLLMTWDILPGREQDYFEFVVREFMPGMQRLGLQPSDAWYTFYGEQPQILVAALMKDIGAMRRLLDSESWVDLTQQLLDYVENFDHKVVEARGGFQL